MLKLTYRIGSDFMHYADIKEYDIANGPGVRVSLFVSGCTHKCKGCFNAEAWDFCYGNLFTEKEEEKILESLGRDYISGITFLGGEPFEHENQKGILPLIRKIKERYPDKSIWCFSGYTFDKDIVGDMCKKWDETNFNYEDFLYSKEAYKANKMAFVSDVARIYASYNEGGFYLDTDVEVIKSIDNIFIFTSIFYS